MKLTGGRVTRRNVDTALKAQRNATLKEHKKFMKAQAARREAIDQGVPALPQPPPLPKIHPDEDEDEDD